MSDALDTLEGLLVAGHSPAEAVDYLMVQEREYTQSDWAERRGVSQQTVSRHVGAVERAEAAEDNRMAILEELKDEGRVEAEPLTPPEEPSVSLETPAGRLEISAEPERASREGADYSRWWVIGGYGINYSIDQTPENRTHTVLVKGGE